MKIITRAGFEPTWELSPYPSHKEASILNMWLSDFGKDEEFRILSFSVNPFAIIIITSCFVVVSVSPPVITDATDSPISIR